LQLLLFSRTATCCPLIIYAAVVCPMGHHVGGNVICHGLSGNVICHGLSPTARQAPRLYASH
jgi:hypothetical protein